MLTIIERFDQQFSCHFQGEYVVWAFFESVALGTSVGGECDMTHLIGGAEERAAVQLATNSWLRKRETLKSFFRYLFFSPYAS